MGLDVFFTKTKPSKGIDVTSPSALAKDKNEQYSKMFNRSIDKLLNQVLIAISPTEREDAIKNLQEFVKKQLKYEWYYNGYTADKTNEEIAKLVESNKQSAYPHSDVYFRKVNFVYAFFSPYLVDESCVVTIDMVNELLEKCEKILEQAHKDGWVDSKGNLIAKLANRHQKHTYEELETIMEKMPKNWVKVAQEELPTTSGCFFGSTEYDNWYLYDVKDCISQFKKLLRTWKAGEVVYNEMSW